MTKIVGNQELHVRAFLLRYDEFPDEECHGCGNWNEPVAVFQIRLGGAEPSTYREPGRMSWNLCANCERKTQPYILPTEDAEPKGGNTDAD